MTEWPLVLAGPILRRVEGDQVSVWVALSEPRVVSLTLYTGVRTVADLADHLTVATAQTVSLGPRLHVALVTATATGALTPDATYSYNLAFGDDGAEDLASLGLLTAHDSPHRHLPLGYEPNQLPNFLTWPQNRADLRVVHGSCRKTLGPGPDALAWVDQLIAQPNTRPHQLFMTGDQIYADEIPANLLDKLIGVGKDLMGDHEQVPLRSTAEVPTDVVCDAENLPPGFRQEMMVTQAAFSTTEGNSHLVSFGEFAAMYVLNWSNVLWPVPDGKPMADCLRPFSTIAAEVPRSGDWWTAYFHDSGATDHNSASPLAAKLEDASPEQFVAVATGTDDGLAKTWAANENTPALRAAFEKDVARFQKQYGTWLEEDTQTRKAIQSFYDTLPEVRRALANVPTYMLADDHEITDDWNVTADWRGRVTNTPLGRTILRNALASYVLFQAWGNAPEYWLNHSGDTLNRILALLASLPGVPDPGLVDGPDGLDAHFGIAGNDHVCKVRFDFAVESPVHKVFALDTRTRRKFDNRLGPSALLDDEALGDDPDTTQLGGVAAGQVPFVISPAPTLSPAVVEEVVWPALMRIWDIKHAAGVIPVHGYEAFDAEAWAFNPPGFEAFVGKLAGYGKAVILSGDVHYAAGAIMDYFYADGARSRIVQFTSSGFKNPFPSFAGAIIRGLSFTQQLLRFGAKIERLGWAAKPGKALNLGTGEPVPPHLKARLDRAPTLIPTRGWPKGTTLAATPDWRWRFQLLGDERFEGERPMTAQTPVTPVAGANDYQGYFQAAQRHIAGFKQFTNSRKVSFAANLGLIRFTDDDTVEQHLYSVHPDHPNAPQAFAVHTASLLPNLDDAPPDFEYVEAQP